MNLYANIKGFVRNNAFLILLLIIASVLSCYRISDCQMTMDEFFSINTAQHSIGEIWSLKPHPRAFYFNRFPPMYETVLHFVWGISNESLFWSRITSVVFNSAALVLIFLISRLLFDRRTALIAAALAAFNYGYLLFSKMIRCYSFLNLLVLASFYIFFRIAKSRTADNKSLAFLLIINTAILYTFYFGVFVVLIELVLSGLFFSRKALVKLWIFLLSTFLLFLPWLGHFLENLFNEPAVHFKITDPGIFRDVLFARFQGGIFHNPGLLIFYSAACFFFILASLYWISKKNNQAPFIISLLAILLPPVLLITYLTAEVDKGLFISALTEPERSRYMLSFIFPVFILGGLFISKLPRYIGGILFSIVLACSIYTLSLYFRLPAQKGFWLAQLAPIAKEAKDFPIPHTDKVIVEIEDSFFVPVFVYYFYGPGYFREMSIPYGGANLRELNNDPKNNYKIVFSVAGIKRFHYFHSVAHLSDFDWLFIIYSDWMDGHWGKHYREAYEEKLAQSKAAGRISLVKKESVGGFTLEIYKIRKWPSR